MKIPETARTRFARKAASVAVLLLGATASAELSWEPLCEPGGGGWIVAIEASPHNPDHAVACGDMLGTGVTFDGGESWTPGSGFLTAEMASPTFHPARTNEVWTGSCSGPYVSLDGGRTWQSRRKGMPKPNRWQYTQMIEKVLIDSAYPEKMYAFGGSSRKWTKSPGMGRIWKSEDGGENWRCTGTVTAKGFATNAVEGANIVKAFWDADGKRMHLVALKAGWFTSADEGRTWTKREPVGLDAEIESVTAHPRDGNVFWATTGLGSKDAEGKYVPGGIYKSTDGGKTFRPSDAGIPKVRNASPNHASRFLGVAVSPHNPDELYASDASWISQGIWKSRDGGKSWEKALNRRDLKTACFAGPSMLISASPSKSDEIWAVNSEYVLKTSDGGKTWRDMTAYRPDPGNAPHNWRGRGWNGWCCTGFVFDPYRKGMSIALAMDAGHGWVSCDGLKTWSYAKGDSDPWSGGTGAAFSKDGYAYVTTGQNGNHNGVLASRDGGKTWRTAIGAKSGLPPRNAGAMHGVWANPENGREAFLLLGGKRYLTSDGGKTWKADESGFRVGTFAKSQAEKNLFYVRNKDGVWSTTDWRDFKELGLKGEARGRMSCDAKGRLLVCRFGAKKDNGLWRYDPADGGWKRLSANPMIHDAKADPADPARIVAATGDYPYHDFAGGDGVWISDDDGATWRRANSGLGVRRFECVSFDPFDTEFVVAGTTGGGFVKARWRRKSKGETE